MEFTRKPLENENEKTLENRTSRWLRETEQQVPEQFIIFNTPSLGFDTKFLVFNAKSMLIFTPWREVLKARVVGHLSVSISINRHFKCKTHQFYYKIHRFQCKIHHA